MAEPSEHEREIIANGKLIESVFKSQGWKKLIAPVFDEMITSVIGCKDNGRWKTGYFIRARKEERKDFHIGYACALQELWNSIQNYVSSAEAIQKMIEERDELPKRPVQIPMVNDETDSEDV